MKMRSHLFTLMGACRRKSGKERGDVINLDLFRLIFSHIILFILQPTTVHSTTQTASKPVSNTSSSCRKKKNRLPPPVSPTVAALRPRPAGRHRRESPKHGRRALSARQTDWTPGENSCCDRRTWAEWFPRHGREGYFCAAGVLDSGRELVLRSANLSRVVPVRKLSVRLVEDE